MSSYSDLIDEIDELREEIDNLQATYKFKQEKLSEEQDKLNNIDITFQEEIAREKDRQISEELNKRTVKITKNIEKAESVLNDFRNKLNYEISKVNIEDFSTEFQEEINLKNNIIQDISNLKQITIDVLGLRVSNKVYELAGKTKFDFQFNDLEDISNECYMLSESVELLDVTKKLNISNFSNKVVQKLRFNVDNKAGVFLFIIYAIILFFLYEYILPVLFIGLVLCSGLYVYSVCKILKVIFSSKAISDNIDRIFETIDNSAQTAMNEYIGELEEKLNNGVDHYQNIIKELKDQKEMIRQEVIRDYVPDIAKQEEDKNNRVSQIKDSIAELESACKSIAIKINNYAEDIKSNMGKIEDAVEDTINDFYSYNTSSYERDKNRAGGRILPVSIPYYKSRDNEGILKLNYFQIPRCKSVFIYKREEEMAMINFVRKLSLGLIMNMKPASIEFTFLDTYRLCQDLRLMSDKELPFRMTYNDTQNVKDLRYRFKNKLASRFNNELLKSLGADEYNRTKIKEGSEPINYEIIIDMLTKDAIESSIAGDTGNSSFDVGLYNYYFVKEDDLLSKDYELMLERVQATFILTDNVFAEYNKSDVIDYLHELEKLEEEQSKLS